MTHTTEQERPKREDFEQWSISTNQGYDLTRNQTGCMRTYEQDKTEHACRGFFHGWLQVERGAQVTPDAYLVYAKGSTRFWVVTLNPDDVPEIYKGGETVPLYRNAAAPHPPEAEKCQSCRTGSPYACTCTFKTDRNSDQSKQGGM